MPSAIERQHERRQIIAQLLREHSVRRQAELVELLRGKGLAATQSSVSRDLKELGAAKLKNGYSLPERTATDNGEALVVVAEFVREIRAAGPNLLVIATAVGAAQRVAVTLDRTGWSEIVGTLSGDDTIFVATAGAGQQRRLSARLRDIFRKAPSHERKQ
jgi:transcriptional regulator of arginine metabolism